MKFFQIIIFTAAGLILSACGGDMKGETKSLAPVPKKIIAIQVASLASKTDLVCGMPLKQGEVADTALYQGKVYGFCGTGCKDDFLKAPGQYLSQQ